MMWNSLVYVHCGYFASYYSSYSPIFDGQIYLGPSPVSRVDNVTDGHVSKWQS